MVAGKRSDAAAVSTFVADANIVIAHNANFDRKFAERYWPEFEHKHYKARVSKEDTSSAQLIATLREASLPTASRQHPRESIVDFVAGRPIIDLRLANFDLLFCDAYTRRVGWRWRKDGLRDAA